MRVHYTPRAQQEIDDQAEYFGRHASPAVAERFLQGVEESATRLSEMPEAGSPWESRDARLAGIRSWPVAGFRKLLMFYRVHEDRVEVLRLLHGSQRLERRLREPE